MTNGYYLVFSPKGGSQVNFQPTYEDTQKDPKRNFFPVNLVNEVLSTLRPLPQMEVFDEQRRLLISLDRQELFNQDFPGGKYSLLEVGHRTRITPAELDPALNGGEVQYRQTESPLTDKEYEAIQSAFRDRNVYFRAYELREVKSE